MAKEKIINFRIDADLKNRARKLAEADGRISEEERVLLSSVLHQFPLADDDLQGRDRGVVTEEGVDPLGGRDGRVLGGKFGAVVGHLRASERAETDGHGQDRDDREPRPPSGESSETACDPFEHC